jgi:membrane-bound lytic murein transglycosylase B
MFNRTAMTLTARSTGYPRQYGGRRWAFILMFIAGLVLGASVPQGYAQAATYQSFLNQLWKDASARGVPRSVFDSAFRGVTPDPSVMALTRKQAEFSETTAGYLAKRVSEARISNGREKARQWTQTLQVLEKTYGVDPYVVLSIWGNETNYGGFMGGHSVIRALSTLAYEGYRTPYFRNELLIALDILAGGHTDPKHMIGSWAGAMGHTQFMPTSFKNFAVDFNGDGRRDIWTTVPDALASTANYLRRMGWRPNETWGYEIILPPNFDFTRAARMGTTSLGEWQKLGVSRPDRSAFPRPDDQAWLHLPGGAQGPAFLMLPNFNVIKRYNNSNNYALAVGYLADRVRGSGSFATPWPPDQAMSTQQRIELQSLLQKRGYALDKIDGKLGPQSRDAIRAFQMQQGLTPDGYPSLALIERLRR